MQIRPRLASPLLVLALLAGLSVPLLTGCSGDSGSGDLVQPPDPDPDPVFDQDTIVFRVITLEAGGVEQLRWIGTPSGPFPESPEQTEVPWIGYARGFRIEWNAYALQGDVPVIGTQYRVSQSDFGPWLPQDTQGNPEWGQDSEFFFANEIGADQLAGKSCPEGPGCEGQWRFDSGTWHIEVLAMTRAGRQFDPDTGRLSFKINYPPVVEIVFDPGTGPDDPMASPVAFWDTLSGEVRRVAFAPGDTLPSGATVRVRLRGHDRIRSAVDTDSFCCDEILEPGGELVGFQGRAVARQVSIRESESTFETIFEAAEQDSVLYMPVGPFDYTVVFRAKDEQGRPGDSQTFDFSGGYPPLAPVASPLDGAIAILHPDLDFGETNTAIERTPGVSRVWNRSIQNWSVTGEGLQLTGTQFSLPLVFRGESDPRVDGISPALPVGYTDHVRSFAYEIVGEADPDNQIENGTGDRSDRYLSADQIGQLDLHGEDAWNLFVPDLFFQTPALFDPAGDCVSAEFCEIGTWLRARIGAFLFRYRSRTADVGSIFTLQPPQQMRAPLEVELDRYGLRSPMVTTAFEVRLAITDADGNLIGTLPPR